MHLLPLCIEDLKEVPIAFGKMEMIKATPDVFDSVSNIVCKAVISHFGGQDVDPKLQRILRRDEVSIIMGIVTTAQN